MTASRFSVAYRPGRVRAWVVLYRSPRGPRLVVGRHLTRDEANAAIPAIAATLQEA
jgi:hypothetical protein